MRGPGPDPLAPALLALADFLDEVRVPWMVQGGVAAGLLGVPRHTVDVDAVALADADRAGDLLEAAARHGFSPRIRGAAEFARRRRILLLRHDASGVPIDLSLGCLPFEREGIERSRTLRVRGRTLRYPTPEDFVIGKAVAHRPRDMEDIRSVLRACAGLDRERIERWVKEFARVLEAPELWADLRPLLRPPAAKKPPRRRGGQR